VSPDLRLAEIEATLQKIARGDAAYRQGRMKTLRSLSESANGMARLSPLSTSHLILKRHCFGWKIKISQRPPNALAGFQAQAQSG
jgi:hypothetical protein